MLFNLLTILGMLLKFLKVVMLYIMVLPRAHLTPRVLSCAEERWTFLLHEQELLKKKWFSSFRIRVLHSILDEHG